MTDTAASAQRKAEGAERRRNSGLFSRRTWVLIALFGGGVLFLSVTQTWVTATGLGDTSAIQQVDIPGTDITDSVTAVALAGMAAAVALTIARRVVRYIIGAVLSLSGFFAIISAGSVTTSPRTSTLVPLGEITGTTEFAQNYELGWAVWGAFAGGAILLVAGIAVLLLSSRWTDGAASKKYDRTRAVQGRQAADQDSAGETPSSAVEEEPDEFDLWDGLSQGEDPTDRRG